MKFNPIFAFLFCLGISSAYADVNYCRSLEFFQGRSQNSLSLKLRHIAGSNDPNDIKAEFSFREIVDYSAEGSPLLSEPQDKAFRISKKVTQLSDSKKLVISPETRDIYGRYFELTIDRESDRTDFGLPRYLAVLSTEGLFSTRYFALECYEDSSLNEYVLTNSSSYYGM